MSGWVAGVQVDWQQEENKASMNREQRGHEDETQGEGVDSRNIVRVSYVSNAQRLYLVVNKICNLTHCSAMISHFVSDRSCVS